MAKINPTTRALVPVSPLRDHDMTSRNRRQSRTPSKTHALQPVDKVHLNEQNTAPAANNVETTTMSAAKDTPQTRAQVRAFYSQQKIAATTNSQTPPGSLLDIHA